MNWCKPDVTVLLLVFAASLSLQAQEGFEWQTNAGTITITSYRLAEAKVVVPATITQLPVTHIGSQAFYRNNNMCEVSLPSSLTHIGYCAFQACGALTNINFPTGLEHIDTSAFDGTGLPVANLPASLRTLGETPFFQCADLQAINVDPANTSFSSLDGVLFSKDHTRLLDYPAGKAGEYLVPTNVVEIADRAFQYARGLTSVRIPGQTKTIGYYAFSGCEVLAEVTLEEGVTHLGDQTFAGCGSLGSIRLPVSLQSLGALCFLSCTSLSQVTLPEGLTTLGGQWAFSGCTALTSITIPGTVENVSYGTFIGCTNLQSALLQEGVKKLEAAFQNCTRLSAVSLPQSLSNIGDNAFDGCSSLASLIIPNGVTNLGWYSFANCGAIQSPTLPGELLTVGRGAFQGCHSIQTVNLPGKVLDVGDSCFENCASLVAINFPAVLASIGARTLFGCPGLQMVNVAAGNAYYSSLDGVLFNSGQTVLLQYPTGRTGSYSVPPTVRRIDYDAFHGARGLTGLTLPPGLEQIRDNAFADCTALTTVRIPGTVVDIGNLAFAYCTNLIGLLFEGNAPSISWGMLYQSPESGVYYHAGATGWAPPPADLAPTIWNGTLSTAPGSSGLSAGGFRITATGNVDIPLAFQACSNLVQSAWSTLSTCRLTNGSVSIVDPIAASLQERYYRVVWP